jgi:hypothetical protein
MDADIAQLRTLLIEAGPSADRHLHSAKQCIRDFRYSLEDFLMDE